MHNTTQECKCTSLNKNGSKSVATPIVIMFTNLTMDTLIHVYVQHFHEHAAICVP